MNKVFTKKEIMEIYLSCMKYAVETKNKKLIRFIIASVLFL